MKKKLSNQQILRKCIDCGLEARTEKDLESFRKNKASKHERMNLCKQCSNKRLRKRMTTDDRFYLQFTLKAMKQRCYNPNSKDYPRYGKRGIIICQEWLESFNAFIDWALAGDWKRELELVIGRGSWR